MQQWKVTNYCQHLYIKIFPSGLERPGWFDRLNTWFVSQYFEILADFTEDAEPEEISARDDQLTVKK